MKRFGRFNLVGILGAGLQTGLIAGLTMFCSGAIAAPVAVEITLLHNFFWHERFTWRDRGGSRMARLWRFHAGNRLISLVGNTALLYTLVDRLHAPVFVSAAAAILICSIVNFWVADRWVFAPGQN